MRARRLSTSGGASTANGKVKQRFPLGTMTSAKADEPLLQFTTTDGRTLQLHLAPDDAKTMAALIRR
jgi:hypothetical protein